MPNAPTQDDFGYNPSTFPEPAPQLEAYHDTLHVRFGGIRKPRIENAAMLAAIKGKGWVLEGSDSNLNFSIPAVQEWYAQQQAHYLQDGVDFWWNDEGETAYEIYHLWNQAHALALAAHDPAKRSFTLNRAGRKHNPLVTKNLLEDTDGLRRPAPSKGGRRNPSVPSRCGSLLLSADVRSSDDVIAF